MINFEICSVLLVSIGRIALIEYAKLKVYHKQYPRLTSQGLNLSIKLSYLNLPKKEGNSSRVFPKFRLT